MSDWISTGSTNTILPIRYTASPRQTVIVGTHIVPLLLQAGILLARHPSIGWIHMTVSNLQELFVHGLEDIYYAEQELLDALQDLEDQTDKSEIAEAFAEHRDETQDQIDRLEDVFQMLDMEPDTEECEGIDGLIEEHKTFVDEEDPTQEVLNLHNLIAGQKTEHYEISAYGNLALLADRLEMNEAGDLLHKSLEEEQEALGKLSGFVDDYDYSKVTETAAD